MCYNLMVLSYMGTLSVQVGLKMAAMRPKHVTKNH